MYRVTMINDGIETVIHSPHVNNLKLETGLIKKEINKVDSFDLSFYQNNPAYGKLKPFKTLINVLNTKTGIYEFEGRILGPDERMMEDGLHTYSYECEGELGYLHDSQQRHLEFRGTPKSLLETILNYHNHQVEEYKQFEVGIVDVTTSTDNIYIYLSAEKSTFEELEDKILNRVGGELRIRKENGTRYLDVLRRVGENKSTEIRIAKNLKSMSRNVDPTQIITRLTPLGTRIESEDTEATDASQARLNIESVNGGLPYLDDINLIEEFGIQGGSITWDDITIASNLKTAGLNWLANQKTVHVQYEISALDLSLIGLDIDNFDIGNSHPIINPIMGINENLRIIGKTTNINNPQDAVLKIGDKFKTLNEYQVDSNKSARKVIELEGIISNQSTRIGSLLNQIDNVNIEIDNVLTAIGDADLEGLSDAIAALELAIGNLNDALDGIPIYNLVTHYEDGLMASTDKVKLDDLQAYEEATEIESGLMSSVDKIKLDGLQNYEEATETTSGLMYFKDKQKLNKITVTENIDLDDILRRLETLEVGGN